MNSMNPINNSTMINLSDIEKRVLEVFTTNKLSEISNSISLEISDDKLSKISNSISLELSKIFSQILSKIVVSVEGNIGVGKSTFIKILESNWDDCQVVSEPVDMWKKLVNSDGKNILQIFYEDIKRWAYSFQNVACITRMMKMEDAIRTSNKKYIFLDRSLETDKNVFEKMLYDDGKINEVEHSMYNLWCDFYYKYVRTHDTIIHIYLKCDPKICAERIKKRGRIEEESIGLDYLIGLDKYHNDWLLNSNLSNIIVIDCNEEFENNPEKQAHMIATIKNKINSILNKKNELIVGSIKNKLVIEHDNILLSNTLEFEHDNTI